MASCVEAGGISVSAPAESHTDVRLPNDLLGNRSTTNIASLNDEISTSGDEASLSTQTPDPKSAFNQERQFSENKRCRGSAVVPRIYPRSVCTVELAPSKGRSNSNFFITETAAARSVMPTATQSSLLSDEACALCRNSQTAAAASVSFDAAATDIAATDIAATDIAATVSEVVGAFSLGPHADILQSASAEDRLLLHLAVVTLYLDQIRPAESEVRHRLIELHASRYLEETFLDLARAVPAHYIVEELAEDAGNASVVYLSRIPPWFQGWVDARDPADPYPPHIWLALRQWLCEQLRSSVSREDGKRGRYGLSKKLKYTGPPEFREYSLGQVCHIMQLAVQLGMMAYDGGALMPAVSCSCVVKRLFPPTTAATVNLDNRASTADSKEVMVVDLEMGIEEAFRGLRRLLETHGKPMLLSQLKLRYVHLTGKRLDPTFFGYSRLSDFINEKCGSVCRLIHDGGRQVLVEPVPAATNVPCDSSSTGSSLPPSKPTGAAAFPVSPLKDICSPTLLLSAAPKVDKSAASVLSVVAKHDRFHSNIGFAHWQHCTEGAYDIADAVKKLSTNATIFPPRIITADDRQRFCHGPSGKFLDRLFAHSLRPSARPMTETEANVGQASASIYQSAAPIYIRWFSRQLLIERQLLSTSCSTLGPRDMCALDSVYHAVLPARGVNTTVDNEHSACGRVTRPSKLRRLITAQILKLKTEYFQKANVFQDSAEF